MSPACATMFPEMVLPFLHLIVVLILPSSLSSAVTAAIYLVLTVDKGPEPQLGQLSDA